MKHNPKIYQSALDIQSAIARHYGYSSSVEEIADDISDMRPGHDRIIQCEDDNGKEQAVTVFMASSGDFLIALNVYCV